MLVTATVNGEVDDLSGCSPAITCGKVPKVGTNGNLDLLYHSIATRKTSRSHTQFGLSESSEEEPSDSEDEGPSIAIS